MAKYFVHNLKAGARPAPAGYSSWLDYWEKRVVEELAFVTEMAVCLWRPMAPMFNLFLAGTNGILSPCVIFATPNLELAFG